MTREQTDPARVDEPVAPVRSDVSPKRLPLLISGVCNCIAAVVWLPFFLLFGPISLGLVILAIVEFKTYADLGRVTDAGPLRGRLKVVGVLELCTGAVGNIPSLICGIVVLTSLPTLRSVEPERVDPEERDAKQRKANGEPQPQQ